MDVDAGMGIGAAAVGDARTAAIVGVAASRAESGVVSASPQAASENGAATSSAAASVRAKAILTAVSRYAPRVRILTL